jgi:hypothetical protein
VELYHAGGISYPQPEREYSVNRSTISGRVKQLSLIKVSGEETVTLKEYKALQKENQRLQIENEILKSDRHIRKRTIAEIVAFIRNHLTDYSVSQLCSALNFPRSTYYQALVCVPSNRRQAYEEFGRKVKQAYGRAGATFCDSKEIQPSTKSGVQILPASMCGKKDGPIWLLSRNCVAAKSSAMPMAPLA